MSDNIAVQYPELEFVRPCNLCPHMKRITLPKIRRALETLEHEVVLDPHIGGTGAALGRTDAGGCDSWTISTLGGRPVIIGGGLAGLVTALDLRRGRSCS